MQKIRSSIANGLELCLFCINSLWPSDAIWLWINIGSGNGLLPDRTKPLPEPILTNNHQWSPGIHLREILLESCNEDPQVFGTHSFCIGWATQLAEDSATDGHIKRTGCLNSQLFKIIFRLINLHPLSSLRNFSFSLHTLPPYWFLPEHIEAETK